MLIIPLAIDVTVSVVPDMDPVKVTLLEGGARVGRLVSADGLGDS